MCSGGGSPAPAPAPPAPAVAPQPRSPRGSARRRRQPDAATWSKSSTSGAMLAASGADTLLAQTGTANLIGGKTLLGL